MKTIKTDNNASAWPVVIFILILMFGSMLILFMGEITEPFLNLMNSTDDEINEEVLEPRSRLTWFFQLWWPKGLLLTIFIGSSLAIFMEYQKRTYQES
jgi:hypothetical protein